jgi:hypothetical protein
MALIASYGNDSAILVFTRTSASARRSRLWRAGDVEVAENTDCAGLSLETKSMIP